MKSKTLLILTVVALLLFPKLNFGQAPPLGAAANFALFTAVGAFSNDGASYVTGDIGTNVGAFTGFPPGTVVGQIHVADPVSVQAAIDVDVAYSFLSAVTCGIVHGILLGGGEILTPNVYCLGAASTLTGTLTLDGQGDPNALFIFKINGALSTSTFSNVVVTNSASLCNVYWQINGQFDLGENSVFSGTIVSNGGINLLEGSSLIGRGLSRGGAIALHNNIVTIGLQPTASTITAGGATTFCTGSSVTLSGNIGGVWSTGAATPSITVTTSGDYYVTNNACGSVTSNHILVTVNPLPAAVAGTNRAICLNASTQIGAAAISGNIYSWSSVPAGFTSTTANPTVTPLVTTIYTVLETISSTGCYNSNSVTVSVKVAPSASTISAGGATTFCAGGSVILSGNIDGVWSTGAATPSITVTTSGDYYVTNNNACGSVTSNHILVTVNPLPAAVAGANRAICLNASTQIGAAAVTGSTYSWSSIPAGYTSTIANPTVSPLVTTTYTVIETNTITGCTNSSSVVVSLNPIPAAVAGANRAICLSTSTQIGAAAVTGSTYSWSSIPAGYTSTIANPTVSPLVTTTYTVIETSTITGCTNSNSIIVSLNPIPAAVAGANRAICLSTSTQIGAAAVAGNTYSWISVPAGFTSTLANPTVTPLLTTIYTLTETTTATGCQNSNSVTVTVNTAPNIITGPFNQTACIGSSISFSVNASGADLTYQWRKGTVNLINGGNISGATSATLTIFPVAASDTASNYNVVITGTCSPNATSVNASLMLNVTPIISTTACVGSSVRFSVPSTGTGLTYQWRRGSVNLINGGNISGVTTALLTINPVNPTDAGSNYNVVITGSCLPNQLTFNVSLVVNPMPIPTIAGPASVCLGTIGNVYGTEAGMTGYTWTVSPGGTITSGAGTNAITVTWNTNGPQTVMVNYTNVYGCNAITATIFNVTIAGLGSPTITGSNNLCVNSGAYSYTTEAGMTGYLWTISAGGTITFGAGSNQIQVVWNTPGTQTVGVFYTDPSGCSPATPASFNVTINPIPGNAGIISGATAICGGTQGVGYTTTPIANTATYVWTLPAGATIASGAGTLSILVNFAANASSGNISVYGNNLCGNGIASALALTVTPNPGTPVVTSTGNMLSSSAPAGNQWYFSITQTGTGAVIPGATDQVYYATQTGWYWTVVSVNGCSSESSNREFVLYVGLQEFQTGIFNIYPVPNDGRFTVSLVSPSLEPFTITVFTYLGIQIQEIKDIRVNGRFDQVIDLRPAISGIYTIVIRDETNHIVKKVVVTK